MKDIFIAYSKEQKNNARRLVAKLESSGFSVWIEPRDVLDGSNRKDAVDKAVAGCKAFVILFASTVDKSDELMELVDLAMVHEKTIVPFVVADVTDSVATRYFLGVNNWIDAFEKTFDQACIDLKDLLDDQFSGQLVKVAPSAKNPNIQNNALFEKAGFKKNKNLIVVLVGIVVLVLGYFMLFTDDSTDSSSPSLTGEWKMTDYSDNLQRPTKQDSIDFQQGLQNLKRNFKLTFGADKTFERVGFQPTPEKGTWEYDEAQKLLYLKGLGSEQRDIVTVQELSKDKLILVVAEKVDNNQVITKITLGKQP